MRIRNCCSAAGRENVLDGARLAEFKIGERDFSVFTECHDECREH